MAIKQMRMGLDNFCYIIYCPETKQSAIVDPGYDAKEPLNFISANNLELKYTILTHYHSDHSSECNRIKEKIPTSQTVASKLDGEKIGKIDVFVSDNDQLQLGNINLRFILTPGHTPGGICIIVDEKAILTGDTLFIGNCGRTDLPGGSLSQMFKTLQEKIKTLPDDFIVCPGHDYGDKPFDNLRNQKRNNITLLANTLEEFSKIP